MSIPLTSTPTRIRSCFGIGSSNQLPVPTSQWDCGLFTSKGYFLLFPTGRLLATPTALDHLTGSGVDTLNIIRRHTSGDWGDIHPDDRHLNDQAVRNGSRVLSAYRIGTELIYVITEWDRRATTILLASEY